MAVEYSVDAHAGPRLSDDPASNVEQFPAGVNEPAIPGGAAPAGWTPQEIESQLMGLWFFAWVGVCLVRWKRPDFAVNFAAQPGEFSASAAALVPVFDAYMPKSIGGPGGALFAAPVVAGEVIAALMRRGPLLERGPAPKPEPAQPGVQRPAPAERPQDSPGSGSYHLPAELVPAPHSYDGIGPSL